MLKLRRVLGKIQQFREGLSLASGLVDDIGKNEGGLKEEMTNCSTWASLLQ